MTYGKLISLNKFTGHKMREAEASSAHPGSRYSQCVPNLYALFHLSFHDLFSKLTSIKIVSRYLCLEAHLFAALWFCIHRPKPEETMLAFRFVGTSNVEGRRPHTQKIIVDLFFV